MYFHLPTMVCTKSVYEEFRQLDRMCLGRNVACPDRLLKKKPIDENTIIYDQNLCNGVFQLFLVKNEQNKYTNFLETPCLQ